MCKCLFFNFMVSDVLPTLPPHLPPPLFQSSSLFQLFNRFFSPPLFFNSLSLFQLFTRLPPPLSSIVNSVFNSSTPLFLSFPSSSIVHPVLDFLTAFPLISLFFHISSLFQLLTAFPLIPLFLYISSLFQHLTASPFPFFQSSFLFQLFIRFPPPSSSIIHPFFNSLTDPPPSPLFLFLNLISILNFYFSLTFISTDPSLSLLHKLIFL